MSDNDIIVGVTGASGAIYTQALVRELLTQGARVHLIPTAHAATTWWMELSTEMAHAPATELDWHGAFDLTSSQTDRLVVRADTNIAAAPASGTFRARAMIVVPCSMNTLAKIAHGVADTLLTRAAAVCLKERRPLVLVARETPLSLADLRNLVAAAEAGAVILPAMPAFYHHPRTLDDLAHFLVSKICDQIGLPCTKPIRYGV
jgi:4-hydroxy-3-polyprenylbenzoate decarboxylase